MILQIHLYHLISEPIHGLRGFSKALGNCRNSPACWNVQDWDFDLIKDKFCFKSVPHSFKGS